MHVTPLHCAASPRRTLYQAASKAHVRRRRVSRARTFIHGKLVGTPGFIMRRHFVRYKAKHDPTRSVTTRPRRNHRHQISLANMTDAGVSHVRINFRLTCFESTLVSQMRRPPKACRSVARIRLPVAAYATICKRFETSARLTITHARRRTCRRCAKG